ncbi:MAG: hypothetical protein K2R98_28470 [Gemmataceae bacterium]|nr:hypothetical protein [Gemmataceae bacterium]
MANRPFELCVVRENGSEYGLALHQQPAARRQNGSTNGHWPVVVHLWGTPLQMVMDQVLAALKEAGYRSSDLSRGRQAPFELPEEIGVRLGLLFLAVKPLRKIGRMTTISDQVQNMAGEETYYWFSKATAATTARRAQKAMRMLLAEE